MITHDFVFDVQVRIDRDKYRFSSIFYNITQSKDQGEILGSIEKEDNLKIYTIDTSEINDDIVGLGLGFKFYQETIKQCFKLGCEEFRSSTVRNENSNRLWERLCLSFYNVEKTKKYYKVILPSKSIL